MSQILHRLSSAVLCFGCLGARAEVGAVKAPAESAVAIPIHGYVQLPYRARWSDTEVRHDLLLNSALTIGQPERSGLSAYVAGRLSAYLADRGDGVGDPFATADRARDDAFTTRLYAGYLNYRGLPGVALVRAGRQSLWETPQFSFFDGARLETKPIGGAARLRLGAFAGRPVNFFESPQGRDLSAGSHAEGRLSPDTRLRMDWMFFGDERDGKDVANHLVSARIWQRIGRPVLLHAGVSGLDGQLRDLRLEGSWRPEGLGLGAQLRYYGLLTGQGELANAIDPFTTIGLREQPYHRADLQLSQRLGRWAFVRGGYVVRRLASGVTAGEFNRDYDRLHGALTVRGLPLAPLELSLSGEGWRSEGRTFSGAGGGVAYVHRAKTGRRVARAEVGTFYRLYRYDLFARTERQDVRIYFCRARAWTVGGLEGDVRYALEDLSGALFHGLRLRGTWRF